MATIFKIGDTDFSGYVSGLKVGMETLLSEESGRNASGNTVVDIIARKEKLYVTLRPLTESEMNTFLTAIADYVVTISYRHPKTNQMRTGVQCYVGTPEPEYYWMANGSALYKPMQINFIEM